MEDITLYSILGETEFKLYSASGGQTAKSISYLQCNVPLKWAVEFYFDDTPAEKEAKLERAKESFRFMLKNLPNFLDRDGGDLGRESNNVS